MDEMGFTMGDADWIGNLSGDHCCFVQILLLMRRKLDAHFAGSQRTHARFERPHGFQC
jgi:hypothetical protein